MAKYVERLWQPEQKTFGLSRKDRQPGVFYAYVPNELDTKLPRLGRLATQASEDALVTLARMDERIGAYGKNKSEKPMTVRDWFGKRLDTNTYYRHPRSYAFTPLNKR